jgi:hypothetical protein
MKRVLIYLRRVHDRKVYCDRAKTNDALRAGVAGWACPTNSLFVDGYRSFDSQKAGSVDFELQNAALQD